MNTVTLLLGVYQSLLLGSLMKYFGIVAGLSQAAPFIVGIALAGFALGARSKEKTRPGWTGVRFVISSVILAFMLITRIYFLNLFRIVLLGDSPLFKMIFMGLTIWSACYLFSYVGYRYSLILEKAERPLMNYALLAAGFAIGTLIYGILSSVSNPDMALAATMVLGMLLADSRTVNIAGTIILVAVIVFSVPIRAHQFRHNAFTWGITEFERQASYWSPYYKVDVITYNDDKYLMGLYNYTGMIIGFRDGVDTGEAGRHIRELHYATIPPAAESALVIGSGGGTQHPVLDVSTLSTLTAVEIDPAIVRFMKEDFSAYNKGFYNDPRVTPVIAEGRTFLEKTDETFDFIEYESLDTRLYTSAMSVVPVEYRLYTAEGLAEAVDHLTTDGLMRITMGTDEDENVVTPLVSGLPEDVYSAVYRLTLDMKQLAGLGGGLVEQNDTLSGWTQKMPQTAIFVSKNKYVIDRINRWYESLGPGAADWIERIEIEPEPDRALADDRPFIGGPGETKTIVLFVILGIIFIIPGLISSRRQKDVYMHSIFYLIGAGYIALEVLLLSRGIRGALNPALTALILASIFVAGNAAACAVAGLIRPGKVSISLVTVLLVVMVLLSGPLTSTPQLSMLSSLAAGFLGGLYWPSALALVRRQERRLALSSDAFGILPGILLFHGTLFISGFKAADIAVAVVLVLVALLFISREDIPH